MRSVTRWVLAAVLAVAAAGAAVAQPPGGGRGQGGGMGGFGGGVYTQVATSKLLAEELKITDEQKGKLKEALEPLQKQQQEMMRSMFQRGGERPSEEERKERGEKLAKLSADMKKAVEGALKPEQAKRLSQISYQQMGVSAFAVKDVQDGLKLTEGQTEKIKGVVEQYGKDRRELGGGFGGRGQGGQGERPSREEMQKRMAENQKKTEALTKDAMEKIEEVLKDEQKDAWKGMVGAKFDVAKLQQEAMQNFRPMRRDD